MIVREITKNSIKFPQNILAKELEIFLWLILLTVNF